ncbi:hypothetical protein O4157_22865, partial [Gordonia amicalis]|uniref:hypothetical protein n=1 Tax=Gordonia amicalis TaxID=89053 RepID=UPI0022B3724A
HPRGKNQLTVVPSRWQLTGDGLDSAPECVTYEGPNLSVDQLQQQRLEAAQKQVRLGQKYRLPGAIEIGNFAETEASAFRDQLALEIPLSPPGSFQSYTRFICDPGDSEPSLLKAMKRNATHLKEQLENMRQDPQYRGIDIVAYGKELNDLNSDYPVLAVVTPLITCSGARSADSTVADAQADNGVEEAARRLAVEGAKILCPDVAGELPPAPVDCGEVALGDPGQKGVVEVRAGNVNCDEATQVITDTWKQLVAEGAKGVFFKSNGVTEYACNIAGAAVSDSEGYDYRCDSPIGDKVITWTEN